MRKFFIFLIVFIFPFKTLAHTDHYKNINKIEMEIFKDGKLIGFCNYVFLHKDKFLEVQNTTKFEVKLFGVKVFSISSDAIEKYKNNQLIYFKSKTMQNNKKKFAEIKYEKNKNGFLINGSSYKGFASLNNVIGNWWNHKILESESQISPLSGSIKEQTVRLLKKETIKLYDKNHEVLHFKLKSKNENLPKEKKLNFDIWMDPQKGLIVKIAYERMGKWEYRLKKFE